MAIGLGRNAAVAEEVPAPEVQYKTDTGLPWMAQGKPVMPSLAASPRDYMDRPNTLAGLEKMYVSASPTFSPFAKRTPERLVPIDAYGNFGDTTLGEGVADANGAMHAKAEIPSDSMAEIHSHPYGIDPKPSDDDFRAAKNRPNFVLSQGALWAAAPGGDKAHPMHVADLSYNKKHLSVNWDKNQPVITRKSNGER